MPNVCLKYEIIFHNFVCRSFSRSFPTPAPAPAEAPALRRTALLRCMFSAIMRGNWAVQSLLSLPPGPPPQSAK
jgi:hypothetical protein